MIRGLGAKLCALFYYFNSERNYDVFKSKSPCFLLNKNINFTKMKWNRKHSFREKNVVLQLIKESQIKSKNCDELDLAKEKRGHFCAAYFVRRNYFDSCVLLQCIVYWIHFQNIYTFIYQKTLLHTLNCLLLKSVESPQCILK